MLGLLTSAIPVVMQLLGQLTPLLPTAAPGLVGSAVDLVAKYGPLVVKGYEGFRPIVTGAIDAIRANPETSANPDWIAKLRETSATIDHRYDDALAKAQAEDAAAGDDEG